METSSQVWTNLISYHEKEFYTAKWKKSFLASGKRKWAFISFI